MSEGKRNMAVVGGLFAIGALLIVAGLLMTYMSTRASDGALNVEPSALENTQNGVKYTYNVDGNDVEFCIGSNLYYNGSKLAFNFVNVSPKTLSVYVKQAQTVKASAENVKTGGQIPVLHTNSLNTGTCEITVDVVDENGKITAHLIGIEGHIEKVDSISEYVN